jgi:hypothetical protein
VEDCLNDWPLRAKRSHARWLLAATFAGALICAMAAARPAAAAVTLGQLAPPGTATPCTPTADYLQPSITGGNLYIARQAGTITSWSTESSGAGATYVFKVFRRTSDPDVFQVVARASMHTLTSGLNTVPVDISVRSGDMIGINESGAMSSCLFSQPGDGVLTRAGNLAPGSSGGFVPQNDVRLNLAALLVPSNSFGVTAVTRDKKQGTATMTVSVSNPGVIALAGKGLKKAHISRNVAVAGSIAFHLAAAGAKKRKLQKTGKVAVAPTLTFSPASGDPASGVVSVKLIMRRVKPPPRLGLPTAQ